MNDVNEETFGFDMGDVDAQDGFEDVPPGDYTMEIVDLNGPKNDKNGNLFMQPKCQILEIHSANVDEKFLGQHFMPYMSLSEERRGYTKGDCLRMGAPDDFVPADLKGLVFNVTLVRRGNFTNMREIEAVEGEAPPEKVEAKTKPKSRRAGARR